MKKTIKPYILLLRRYPGMLFSLALNRNWIKGYAGKKGNATFFIKTLMIIIIEAFGYSQTTRAKTCGQVNNFFLQNLSKPYSLFGSFCYICGRVWGNWGVAFYKMLIIIIVALVDYLKQSVTSFGSVLFYADLRLITLTSNGFSQFHSVIIEC